MPAWPTWGIARRLTNMGQTTTFRLTAGLSVVFTVAAIALITLISTLTEAELTLRTDQVLAHEMRRLTGMPVARLPAEISSLIADSASGLNYYALVGADGKTLAGNFSLQTVPVDGGAFEVAQRLAAPVPLRALVTRLPNGERVEVARDISQITDLRHTIFAITVYSGVVVIATALLAGAMLSRGPLRRVAQIRGVASRIAAGELRLRMPVAGRGDELDLIAGMVNRMLDEIERLMDQVKGTTDAIAHDLRAPLAHLRQRLQALAHAQGEDPDGPVAAEMTDAMIDVDQILRRFNALLRISELEASGRHAGFTSVDPMTLLADIAELYEPVAEERGIALSLHGAYGQTLRGDETLLLEAISNLVENALKFIASDVHVILSVADLGKATIISVCDDGPGIPVAERALVLNRFQRGAGAGRTPGMGLGLNLVAAIAHLHGFDLTLDDARPGLKVTISCPKVHESE